MGTAQEDKDTSLCGRGQAARMSQQFTRLSYRGGSTRADSVESICLIRLPRTPWKTAAGLPITEDSGDRCVSAVCPSWRRAIPTRPGLEAPPPREEAPSPSSQMREGSAAHLMSLSLHLSEQGSDQVTSKVPPKSKLLSMQSSPGWGVRGGWHRLRGPEYAGITGGAGRLAPPPRS